VTRRHVSTGLFAAISVATATASHRAVAEQARISSIPSVVLRTGDSQGIAVTNLGRLFLAPSVSPLAATKPNPLAAQVFGASHDAAGNVFLATGPDGAVVKVSSLGEATLFFRAAEPLVTAVAVLAGGDLPAATAPGGKIYRIPPSGRGAIWCETQERYVWALAARSNGEVLAATGERGRLLSIDRSGKSTILFDSDESHLVSLAPSQDGGTWVGGSGRGLVYHVDAEGHASVLYDDDLPEAKAIAVDPSGRILAAFDAPPVTERRPPAVRIRVAEGGTSPSGGMEELDARGSPALQGVIEGLPLGQEDEGIRVRGKVVRIAPDGMSTELWRSTEEAPFALAVDGAGRAVFATGEPARLWRVESDSETALLATLPEAQASVLFPLGKNLIAATSNPAGVYRIDREPAKTGTFIAPPSDAGGFARWGRLAWRADPTGGRVELFTRTGNSEDPDGTWSSWSGALGDARGTPITNPEGRFLQWRVKMLESSGQPPAIIGVTATYATRNRPPWLRDVRIEPANGAVSAKATFRWSTSDPDGDAVAVEIEARPIGFKEWKSAARTDPPAPKPSDPSLGNDSSSKDGKTTWDVASWDEGTYEVRARATDQPANPPTEGLDEVSDPAIIVRIDRTPPAIDAKRDGSGGLDVSVTDTVSSVAKLEVVDGGKVLSAPRAKDGVCDGPRELFHIDATELRGSGSSLRATDAAGNAAEVEVPAR